MAINAAKINRLQSQLLTSGIQQQNPALFQIINELIKAVRQLIESSNTSFIDNTDLQNVVDSILAANFIMSSDMSSLFINSRELLAGFNIVVDNSVANKTTVSQVVANINDANDIFFPDFSFFENPFCPCDSEEN